MGSMTALVLRTQAVDAVEVVRGLKGAQTAKTVRVPVLGTTDDVVPQAIRAALERAQIKAKRVPVAIPSEEVLLRFFTLPLLPKSEWRTTVQFEVRKYIPFKVDELVWVFHIVEQKQARQMQVAFLGIRTDRLRRIQQWLSAAGVQPLCLEPHPVTLARLAPKAPKGSDQVFTAVIEVEAEAAHVVIAQDQVPYFSRDISWKPGAEGEGALAPGQRTERLLSELSVSMDFFKRAQPSAAISRVIVFGNADELGPSLAAWATELGCPVELGRLPVTVPGVSVGLEWAAALSAASTTRRGPFDFLGVESGAKASAKPAMPMKLSLSEADLVPLVKGMARPATWQAAVAAVLVGVFMVFSHERVETARQRMHRAVAALPDVGWQLKGRPIDELEPLRDQAAQRLALLRNIIQQRVSVTKKLEGLTKTLPDGIWLEGFVYQDHPVPATGNSRPSLVLQGACYLSGSGGELAAISTFAQRIKQNPAVFQGFAVAQIGGVTQTKDETQQHTYWKFQLNSDAERRAF